MRRARAARCATVALGLALSASLAVPAFAGPREPREPRKPGEARTGERDGGPAARSGNASASNSVSGVGRGHVTQRTSVSTGDVVVGSSVEGSGNGNGTGATTSGGSGDGEAPPESTVSVSSEAATSPVPTPVDGVISRERLASAPASSRAERPDMSWFLAGGALAGFALFRRLTRPRPA